ncbi:MAG: undecaprenyl-diphosphate phosphatase [Geodermatophilaceae bacterium]|nr:undecaprenyl-diphosphate phosphatase [Geodermatophilaceae bacterium]
MGWFEAIVLGLVQGLTEFLPISSSAHLRIVGDLAGWDDPGAAFTAVSQIGTEMAVLIYFRRDIARIVVAWLRSIRGLRWPGARTGAGRHASPGPASDPDARIGWLIILGTIPIGFFGFVFRDTITGPLRDLRIVAAMLILLGIVLAIADRVGSRDRELIQLTPTHGVAIGFAQALALIPGVSRSGATTSAGLFFGYTRPEAARYSFLLAIPAVLISGAFEALDIGSDETTAWPQTIVGTLVAGLVGYVVIAFFMRYISTHTFTPFVVYRIALGVLVFTLLATGALTPT